MVANNGSQFKEVISEEEHRFEIEDEEFDKEEFNNLLQSTAVHAKFLEEQEEEEESVGPWSLWGFYVYSFASEVSQIACFAIVAASLFLPITLEQLARDNGYTLPNHDSACSGSLKSIPAEALATDFSNACEVKLLGSWVETASFPLYVFSISVAIQAFVVGSLGDAADNPNVALGVSGVCLNSFIPNLAKTRPKVLDAQRDPIRHSLSITGEDEHYKTLLSNATADISSNGVALGGVSGIIALCLCLIVIISHDGNTDSLRWAIGFSGIWWAVFSIPAVFLLPPHRALNYSEIVNPFNPAKSFGRYWSMLREYKQLKNTIRFLMAWFLLSDAFSTLTSTAILFAKTSLEMSSSHLIFIGVIVPTTGIIGAVLAPRIQQRLKYCSGLNGSLNMFKLLIGFSCLVPGYVSITLVFGIPVLTTEAEMFVLAGVFGLFYGAFQSYARSVYAELIPPGHEAKWYALYSITDKSSSFFGPLVVGMIADYTHNIRYGFLFILAVLVLSFPILNHVDVPSGKLKAEEFSRNSKD
ncbi:hypothetical protein H4Q26_014186 [Puccinia striiformis f. sp. tritici PST-130]|nr:hypothetical protein H4Q26_014186 [Puccinia striiformis f. sp. tritici PST-130]